MYTIIERERIRDDLMRAAREDEDVTAAALVGSTAFDRTDLWSDIDLALRLRPDLAVETTARRWTTRMYADHGTVHHVDVWSGSALYRVFLLPNTLQVDVSFCPSDTFAARGEKFQLLFGETIEVPKPTSSVEAMIGLGWLYALHVRSSLARGRVWQAVYMLDHLRDQVASLASLRHGLPSNEGRGVDDLPAGEKDLLVGTLPLSPGAKELHDAFACAARLLIDEAGHVDAGLSLRLEEPLAELVRSSR